jgi:hypothetical protein
MSRGCHSVFERAGLLAAVGAAAGAFAVPVAAAAGPPQGGGGCHMVGSPSSSGLEHMMAGASNGEGQGNMIDMLSRFSPDPFCGL